MPNIENLMGVGATSLDKVMKVSASSVEKVMGVDLVTFSPSIYSTINGNLSAGTWAVPAGAAYLSIIAIGAGGGPANYASLHSNLGNQHSQSGTGGGGCAYSGSVSTANFNNVNISIGAGATATSGGTTTVTFGNTTLTANGGGSGNNAPSNNTSCPGGTASGGNVNLTGGNGGYHAYQATGYANENKHGSGGGGNGGYGWGSNTNHYYSNGGNPPGYGNTAVQNGINQGSQVMQTYLMGGTGSSGGGGGYYNGGGRGIYSGPSYPGYHRYHSNPASGTVYGGGDYTTSPTDGNTKTDVGHGHGNNAYATRKGGMGSGGGAAYGANYNQQVINGNTNTADLTQSGGGVPAAGGCIIFAYATE